MKANVNELFDVFDIEYTTKQGETEQKYTANGDGCPATANDIKINSITYNGTEVLQLIRGFESNDVHYRDPLMLSIFLLNCSDVEKNAIIDLIVILAIDENYTGIEAMISGHLETIKN